MDDIPPPRPTNALLETLKAHRLYRVGGGYIVAAWVVLQAAAIVLPGFGAPPWVLRGLMIFLALGFGMALLGGWALDRRAAGRTLVPHAPRGRLAWGLTALLPAVLVTMFFLLRPLPRPASAVQPPAAAIAPAPAATAAVPDKSVAVLPFENLSADKENAFFADGVQDEVLTDLSKVADLKVISRTSVMQFKDASLNLREIALALGVAYVVEGSVQRAGNKVRVTAQLIDARTDAHRWAEHYDRDLSDVFAIQSEIAEAIAGQLQARLSPQEKTAIDAPPTADFEAYDLYLRAQSLYADFSDPIHAIEKLPAAVRLLDEALGRDPKFLRAWCLLEKVHCNLYWQGQDHTPARLAQAHAALQRAQSLQPDAGETHLAIADYSYRGLRDFDRALAELDLAQRTLPNNAQVYEYKGYIHRRQGRWTETVRDMDRSLELDPRNFITLSQQRATYEILQRYDDQVRLLDRMLVVKPGEPSARIMRAAVALNARADLRPFQETLATLIKEDPANGPDVDDPDIALCEHTPEAARRMLANVPPEGLPINGTAWPHAYWEGVVARCEGDAPRARAAFTAARGAVEKTVAAQPNLGVAVSLLGLIDAGLGRKEQAIAEGRRGCELLPVSKDGVDGAFLAVNLAQIYTWTGEQAAAVEQIAEVRKSPSLLSYGLLKLNPIWDALRGNPRFEALVASLAPKP